VASADEPMSRDGRAGEDVLDLLAQAVLLRLDKALVERAAASPAPEVHPEPGWLRVSEVARRVGASERTVYRGLRSGALAGERLGAHWRIRPESVERWLADPRPPRTAGTGRDQRPAAPVPRSGDEPAMAFMTRAKRRHASPDASGRTTTSRGEPATRREQR